jgi:hypothetical protein
MKAAKRKSSNLLTVVGSIRTGMRRVLRRWRPSPHQRTFKMNLPLTSPEQGNPAVDGAAVKAEYRPEASSNPEDDVTFTSFVMSLGTQTMVQLGEMDPPPGMEVPIDVEAARQTIDILSMLQTKTKGNLSPDESRFLVEVLHTLRMSYVRKSQQ